MITVPLQTEFLRKIELKKFPSPLRPTFETSITVDPVFNLFLQKYANLLKLLMIKGFIIQKVLLICILEIPILLILKNDKTDSKSDELEIPVTWTLRRLFLYTVRHILSPRRKTFNIGLVLFK